MRIRLSELRHIIRQVIVEQTDMPGRFRGNASGKPGATGRDLERLGNRGFLLGLEEEDDADEEVSFVHLDEGGPVGPGVTANPTDTKGFYPYDLPKLDIYGYWDRSPGDKGGKKPYREDDAAEQLGFKLKGATPADAAAEAAPPPIGGKQVK